MRYTDAMCIALGYNDEGPIYIITQTKAAGFSECNILRKCSII